MSHLPKQHQDDVSTSLAFNSEDGVDVFLCKQAQKVISQTLVSHISTLSNIHTG